MTTGEQVPHSGACMFGEASPVDGLVPVSTFGGVFVTLVGSLLALVYGQ